MSVMSASLVPAGIDVVTRYLDLAGVCSCALLGGAVARTARLDLFGFLVVGVVSGLGGGVIRDVLLQHGTPVALTDYAYLAVAFAGAAVAFLIRISEQSWTRLFTVLDAAAIGFWAVAGANRTLAVGLGWLPAVMLGTLTAVGGGALRDVILGRVPAVFGGNGLYATVALVVAAVTVLCSYLGIPGVGIGLGVAVALVFRLTAVHFGWNLPSGLDWQPHSQLASLMRRRSRPATGRGGKSHSHKEEP
ncbi:trimeric intracellular cation channel family protein [Streptomyces sp. Y2F8-2]|uniref:trimeric intracellular cation channel family protein n=1 Tax=Streptomyces sp. Y2F8-2 TaxID=2759675 RepID=UPI001908823C|nr:TRIC cation channel family protein [Streptomyces sp. Y2F8-2]